MKGRARVRLAHFFTVFCLITGCVQQEDPLQAYGLEATQHQIDIAKQAVDNANRVLRKAGYTELYLYQDTAQRERIPVLWVGDKSLSRALTDMLFVTGDLVSIVAQAEIYFEWMGNYHTVGGTNYATQDDAVNLLSYLLLHEFGHIHAGHPGRALGDDTSPLNDSDTLSKAREQEADDFAASLLATVNSDEADFENWMIAANITSAISSFAFTLQGKRLVDDTACSILDAPCAFHDMGDTHYNLEYRILKAQCLISGELACDPLADFEQRRNSGGIFPDGVLYRATGED